MIKNILLFSLCLVPYLGFSQINLGTGLKAHYTFNGNANDATGSFNASVNGATLTTDRFGNSNSAYLFDGVDDFLEIPASANLKLGNTESYTISLYAKIDSTSGTYTYASGGSPSTQTYLGGALVTRYGCTQVNGAADWLKIGYTNNSLYSGLREKNGSNVAQINKSFTTSSFYGQYHHIALVRSAGAAFATMFVDGSLAGTVSLSQSGGMSTDNLAWWIGKDMSCNDGAAHDDYKFFKGKIDEIRIYSRVLNSCELNLLANGLASANPTSNSAFTGFKARYLLDGNANDAGANAYDGTVNGATAASDRFSQGNKSYSFDGNDYISVPASKDLKMAAAENYSIMIIAKVDTTSGWYTSGSSSSSSQLRYNGGCLISRYGCPQVAFASDWLKIRYESSSVIFELREKMGLSLTSIQHSVSASFFSSYHQYIGIRDVSNSKVYFYIDGAKVGEANLSNQGGMSTSGIEWWIGKDKACNDGIPHSDYRFMKGKIDEIGIYNRALDSCEIASLHDYFTTEATGVKHIAQLKNSFSLYPNPSRNGDFTVKLGYTPKAPVNVEVRNMLGQVLFSSMAEVSNNQLAISGMNLPAGIYLVTVAGETQKLLVE